MRTKAILSSILLASTALAGVASADPFVRDHRNEPVYSYPQQEYWQNHYQQPVYSPPAAQQQPYGFQVDNDGDEVQPYSYGADPSVEYTPRSSWVNLAEDTRLAWWGATSVPVNGRRLTAIELQGERGRTFVQQVRVQFTDGRVIAVDTQRMLDSQRAPNLRVDIGSATCGIRRVVVVGRGGGQFRVLGA